MKVGRLKLEAGSKKLEKTLLAIYLIFSPFTDSRSHLRCPRVAEALAEAQATVGNASPECLFLG